MAKDSKTPFSNYEEYGGSPLLGVNEDLSRMVDTSDEWIRTRMGHQGTSHLEPLRFFHRARERHTLQAQSCSRSFSTARLFFAAKLRNSAKRPANQFGQHWL